MKLQRKDEKMLIALYPTKKSLKAEVGKALKYTETSAFGPEYKDNGTFCVCNRPSHPDGCKEPGAREFFAEVTMKDGLIVKVE